MDQTSQSDIDALLGQTEQGSENGPAEELNAQEEPAHLQNTAESQSGQEEVSMGADETSGSTPGEKKTPAGTPWVDFVPEFTHPRPETFVAALVEEEMNLDDRLKEKEWLKVALLDRGAHKAYYQMWVRDSNSLFRSLLRVRYRRLAEEKGTSWEC
ncbi:MAG: hypothetical protein H6618_02055 [Deltaproteobacteria bacterium]|nr:hypothetical protein [Deltaproteobacteria bacterium]